jgi:hypothetical protein
VPDAPKENNLVLFHLIFCLDKLADALVAHS